MPSIADIKYIARLYIFSLSSYTRPSVRLLRFHMTRLVVFWSSAAPALRACDLYLPRRCVFAGFHQCCDRPGKSPECDSRFVVFGPGGRLLLIRIVASSF